MVWIKSICIDCGYQRYVMEVALTHFRCMCVKVAMIIRIIHSSASLVDRECEAL